MGGWGPGEEERQSRCGDADGHGRQRRAIVRTTPGVAVARNARLQARIRAAAEGKHAPLLDRTADSRGTAG
jgi:hypothetical protein